MTEKSKIKDGILSKMPKQKLYQLIGQITCLLMISKSHRKFQVRYIPDIILPAINLNQFRIYWNSKKQPVALVTWAFFSEEVESKYLGGKIALSEKELKSGDIIYITDFIAPYGHTKKIIKDLQTKIFPDKEVKALRFTEQGNPSKKIWKFQGVNYKRNLN
jgi:cytolysin-activating lysine-acyltransferase